MNFPLSVRLRLIKYAIICKRVRVPIYEHAFADILSARMHALARSRPVHYNPLSIARARTLSKIYAPERGECRARVERQHARMR